MSTTLDTILLPTLERLRALYADSPGIPSGRLRAIAVKPGWNVVLGTEGQHGAAMNFEGIEPGCPGPDLERLRSWVGLPLLQVALLALRRTCWHERAVGVAALSALSQPFLLPGALASRGLEAADRDFAGLVTPADSVALVGFGGMVSRLLGRCGELHVTDMRPRNEFQALVIEEKVSHSPAGVQVHGPEDNEAVLGAADAVAITGSTLVNGTCAELIACARRARLVAVYGASAAFIPDVLFECGVTLVQAHRVSAPDAFEAGVRQEMQLERTVQQTQTFQTLVRRGR